MRITTLASLASVLAAAAGAAAQCDWYMSGVPDFDQRRENTGSVNGLPDDGSSYCVPTSCCNWLAYLANHGYPGIFSGPRQWQSNGNYNYVTARDATMGTLMGTDPQNGTGGLGRVNGLTTYLNSTAPGLFVVTYTCPDDGYAPNPDDLQAVHDFGAVIAISYGRYNVGSNGCRSRDGGHTTSLVGIENLCSPGATILKVRDPADDSADTTQSTFKTVSFTLQSVTGQFRTKETEACSNRTEWRINELSSEKYFDSFTAIWPLFGMTSGVGLDAEVIQLLRPIQLTGQSFPVVQSFPTATGGTIRDLVLGSRLTSCLYVTGPNGAAPAGVYRLNPITGVSTPAGGAFANPTRLATNRSGDMYVLDGDTIYLADPDSSGGALPRPSTNSQDVDAITFNDITDLLIGFNAGRGKFYQWNQGLGGGFGELALPPGPIFQGRISICISPPDGTLWACGRLSDTLYKLGAASGGVLTLLDTVSLPPGTNPTGLNVTRDGHVHFSSNGSPVEMEKVGGAWQTVPNSRFSGLPTGVAFVLARTRTNFDPETMSGPEWHDLPDTEVLPGVPDCYANCDNSTVFPRLNVQDFACYLNKFAAGDPEANCDFSTTPPVLNVQDFACFLNAFATGCP